VGVLNSGDSDGVIFPNASLSFLQNIEVKLIGLAASRVSPYEPPTALPPPLPVEAPSGYVAAPFNVVRAHSFLELTLGIDAINTPAGTQEPLLSAVEHESQERFTIVLKSSSSKPIAGESNLPG